MRAAYLSSSGSRPSAQSTITTVIPSRLGLQVSRIIYPPAVPIPGVISPGTIISITTSAVEIMVVVSSPFSGSVSSRWPISIFVAPVYGMIWSSKRISIARAVAPTIPSLNITRMVRNCKIRYEYAMRHTYLWAAGSAVTAPIIPPGSIIAIILSARPSG